MHGLRQLAIAAALLPAAAAFASSDHWIYDADVVLYDDYDADGYFRFISVRLDADSLRSSAWVYAELWLSADGTTWEHYHSTDDFWIGGETGDDELFIETELLSGYPTGHYDLLIELYDADFGTFSDEFGPFQSDGFALLALEDAEHDPEPVQVVTVVDGGGGAMSWLLLPGLLAAGWRLRRGGGPRTPRASGFS